MGLLDTQDQVSALTIPLCFFLSAFYDDPQFHTDLFLNLLRMHKLYQLLSDMQLYHMLYAS